MRQALGPHHDSLSGLGSALLPRSGAAHDGCNTNQGSDNRLNAGPVKLNAHAGQMATCNVARLMGQNADDLVGCFGPRQQAGVNEQALAAGDEGVNLVIVDDINPHRRRVQARRLENRLGVEPQQPFNFRVANERERWPPRASSWWQQCHQPPDP